jgi:neutral ceramidase
VADVVMQGYARMAQVTTGLNQRLYARAYVFANANGPRVVFVSAELGQLFGGVKQGVLRKLTAQYGGLYTDRNLMVTATHTHAGPGGYAHFALYNFTSYGYVPQNYDAIVNGITAAIVTAHNSLAPATIRVGTGPVNLASVNRSQIAFNANRDAAGQPSMSREMALLRIDRASGPAGVISWFDVHNTSLSRMNTLVSSDHKGYASYLFEAERGTIQPIQAPNGFVAAFANGAFGDQSPNINVNFTGPGGADDFRSMRIIGEREYSAAAAIFGGPLASVRGAVDFRHSFVSMPGLLVASSERNGIGLSTLCRGAYGASFATGSEDGRSGEPGFTEGMRFEQRDAQGWRDAANAFGNGLMPPFLRGGFNVMTAAFNDPCQLPKPILIPSGVLGWSPEILPFQLLRVGNVVIAGIPGEMTIQAGRRLHGALLSSLRNVGVTHVMLTGLANEYSGYITTAEEYDTQQYEGASTQYGRLTFDAHLQLFGKLAGEMMAGVPSVPGPTPPDISASQLSFQTGVVYDDKRVWETFGQVMTEPPATVQLGGSLTVTFRAGHPKNKLNTGWSYYFVERLTPSGVWASQVWDSMPEGTFTWRRDKSVDCLACSFADVTWNVPRNARPGTYRITHNGAWKNGFSGALTAYQGATRTFEVR